ncbi:MAG: tetratricopeptide repeat protein [Gemmatimonadota bacterium]|nr:tetratricopeptide repeat protein [Gemmatimonadota bacterium]
MQPGAPLTPRIADEESIGEWFALHKNTLAATAVALAILVGGAWFYERSQGIKAERAEKAYYQGRQEAAAGNVALATSDLKKAADRYSGTRAGTEARIYLAQMDYDQKKFKEGVAELKLAEKGMGSSDDFAPSVHLLEANGYEELKDFVNAADQYRLAAEASRFPNDKSRYRASQARALMAAGKRADALAIWVELAKDESGPFLLEAKLRIGELQAAAAKV